MPPNKKQPRGPYKTSTTRRQIERAILAAATYAFSINGYNGTSMQSIADRAQVPKANVHYYFKNKAGIYVAVLESVLLRWDSVLNNITPDDDPAQALCDYIDAKMAFSRTHPQESRVFAKEMLSGAPYLQKFLQSRYQEWFIDRIGVLNSWIEQGKIVPINPAHLLFLIWGSTQHYADFEPQVRVSLGINQLTQQTYEQAANSIKIIVLRGCGLPTENILKNITNEVN